jgi:hypothetical protein
MNCLPLKFHEVSLIAIDEADIAQTFTQSLFSIQTNNLRLNYLKILGSNEETLRLN